MRIQFVCLLLVLLSATVLSKNKNIKYRYNKFINQHIIAEMEVCSCDSVMRTRKIERKQINTFIISDIPAVRSICVGNGEPDGNLTKSIKRFNIVVCKLRKCIYFGEIKEKKKVIIKCEGGFPVHYGRDIDHCEN
ncbi:ribonuclease-like 3 [Cottoperca gobio]|uniref:Ribonuclease-like 3 n=1 Tax=Cottoperca gobio TaxID=56716 RepID=A0A6J2QKS7_COTGO|nr:angiogenin [Cottoperca gobio]